MSYLTQAEVDEIISENFPQCPTTTTIRAMVYLQNANPGDGPGEQSAP